MKGLKFWLSREVLVGVVFVALLMVPVFVFGGSKTIFVDKDANGSEDGSFSHPYRTISRALKHAKSGDEVRIKNGTYKENITIPKDIKVVGDSKKRDKVIIKADNDDKPTVEMKDDAELSYVTVKDGRHGIRVREDAEAHIFNVVVKDNRRDGIHVDSAPRDKKHRLFIDEVVVKDNGKAGIYSEKRFILIVNSEIESNKGDGIDLAAGTKAWFEDSKFKSNGGSGAKLVLDGASIFSKNNSFRHNGREGIEVNAFGGQGTIEFKKASFIDNKRYGVARVARTQSGAGMFGNLSFGLGVNSSRVESNTQGNVSPVFRSF